MAQFRQDLKEEPHVKDKLNLKEKIGRLQFLTMDDAPLDHLAQVEMACQAGIKWIQLRMKQAGETGFLQTAGKAKEICDQWGCLLIINDRPDVAAAVKADGVHVGKLDMPVAEARLQLGADAIIGGTANTVEDILEHHRQGADYVGLGPYRFTTTKKKLSPVLGLDGYLAIMQALRQKDITIPVVAIGGVTVVDLPSLVAAGLHGIAFSGLLVHASDKMATVRSMHRYMEEFGRIIKQPM